MNIKLFNCDSGLKVGWLHINWIWKCCLNAERVQSIWYAWKLLPHLTPHCDIKATRYLMTAYWISIFHKMAIKEYLVELDQRQNSLWMKTLRSQDIDCHSTEHTEHAAHCSAIIMHLSTSHNRKIIGLKLITAIKKSNRPVSVGLLGRTLCLCPDDMLAL